MWDYHLSPSLKNTKAKRNCEGENQRPMQKKVIKSVWDYHLSPSLKNTKAKRNCEGERRQPLLSQSAITASLSQPPITAIVITVIVHSLTLLHHLSSAASFAAPLLSAPPAELWADSSHPTTRKITAHSQRSITQKPTLYLMRGDFFITPQGTFLKL